MTKMLGLSRLGQASVAAIALAALTAPALADQDDYNAAFQACEAAIAAQAGVTAEELSFDVRNIRSSARATKVVYHVTRADGAPLESDAVECKVSKRSGEVTLEDA